VPATSPAKLTLPASTARTTTAGPVPYSSPRFPGHHRHAGSRNGSTTEASTGGNQHAPTVPGTASTTMTAIVLAIAAIPADRGTSGVARRERPSDMEPDMRPDM
jgi:hypothetical protein